MWVFNAIERMQRIYTMLQCSEDLLPEKSLKARKGQFERNFKNETPTKYWSQFNICDKLTFRF